jgi:hypothetical protein
MLAITALSSNHVQTPGGPVARSKLLSYIADLLTFSKIAFS